MFKIAILGPESTGKTELAALLAKHFDGEWVPEYARSYIENLGQAYNFQDICNIAIRQIEQENEYLHRPGNGYVFFDTDLIITKVWFEYCYKTVPDFVTKHLEKNIYDAYLLCLPDLPWQPDKVREHGSDRDFFFEWYQKEIEKTGKPFRITGGTGHQRLLNAIEAVNTMLKTDRNE